MLLMLLVVLAGWQCRHAAGWRPAALAGLTCGLAVAVRPTNLLFAVPILVWALWPPAERLAAGLAAMAAFGAALAPFVVYNLLVFGRVTGLYQSDLLRGSWLTGAAGILASPGRGLLIYFPLAALAPWGLVRAWRRGGPLAGLAAALAAAVLADVLLFALAFNWWGGVSFAPRLLSETQPALLLLCVPLVAPVPAWPPLRWVWIGLAAWSSCLQAVGGFSTPPPGTPHPSPSTSRRGAPGTGGTIPWPATCGATTSTACSSRRGPSRSGVPPIAPRHGWWRGPASAWRCRSRCATSAASAGSPSAITRAATASS
ncbi:MAG TPA: hypothetical protein VGV61_10750 [Thermoanaerobaculia bacterium]|nr:hypothetical protein [Thermoanaerobaculia bacterium]